MQVLKPMVEELGKKFPKKEDAMKKQQATMDLYKRAGVNPMGGCLPMLLQMPILFAMFRFFPVSIELRRHTSSGHRPVNIRFNTASSFS